MSNVIEKIIFTKIPFCIYFIVSCLPVLFPETENWPLAFWVFYYILWIWLWSWLLAGWMSFNFVENEQINLEILSGVVGRIFLHQVKLLVASSVSALIVAVPTCFLLTQILMRLASPEEVRSLQIGLSYGNFSEPGLSFFLQILVITAVIPAFIFFIVYFRCGFGMLALLQGSEKVGLMASWGKSKGTMSLALKSIIPVYVVFALSMYVGTIIISLGIFPNFILQSVSIVVGISMWCQALARYYGQLQSKSEE
jgi:hypothetical protein